MQHSLLQTIRDVRGRVTMLLEAHSVDVMGLLEQKESEVKPLGEVGARLAKLVLAQKWLTSSCSKMFFLFPC